MICCVASRRVKAVTVMSWVRSNTVEYVFKIGEVLSSIIFLYSAVSLLNQQRFTTVNDKEN